MKSSAAASLFNLSILLFVIPVLILMGVVAFFLLNSPAGSPLFQSAAHFFMKRQNFALAAYCYEKLYQFKFLLGEGKEHARQAAFCYEQLHHMSEAIAWYTKIQDWSKIGQLYVDMGKFDKAEAVFQDAQLHSRLAYCYELQNKHYEVAGLYDTLLGNAHKALRFYEKALIATASLSPERQAEIQLHIIRLLIQIKRTEEANQRWQILGQLFMEKPHLQTDPTLKRLESEVKDLLAGQTEVET